MCRTSGATGRRAVGELVHEPLDMFTTVLIGNAETQERFGRMLTPRGYRP